MSQVSEKKPCVASFKVEKNFDIFSFHLQNEILEGRKIRISLVIFLYPKKSFFFRFSKCDCKSVGGVGVDDRYQGK